MNRVDVREIFNAFSPCGIRYVLLVRQTFTSAAQQNVLSAALTDSFVEDEQGRHQGGGSTLLAYHSVWQPVRLDARQTFTSAARQNTPGAALTDCLVH